MADVNYIAIQLRASLYFCIDVITRLFAAHTIVERNRQYTELSGGECAESKIHSPVLLEELIYESNRFRTS